MEKPTEVRQVIVTRTLDATPQVAFEDWIYSNKLCRWWGPKDFTNPVCTVHAHPGGAMLVHMQAPDGTIHLMKGLFHEVRQPERIVLTTYAMDDHDHPVLEVLNTITFTPQEDKTLIKVRAEVLNAKPEGVQFMAGMKQGWTESLDRLAALNTKL
ncbi:MAG: activator of ATPase [Bacteroidetes bacterium]|nr:activator of ATPase [Bacteroidota bacterium]